MDLIKTFASINYFYWLLISLLFYAGGEFFSKKFAMHPRVSTVVLILFFYCLGALAWIVALYGKDELAIVGTTWAVLSAMVTVSIGVFIFGEKLNWMGFSGIILAIASIILLSMA